MTIALHDVIRVSVARGTGIEIKCSDQRVPCDESNTCYRVAERVMEELYATGQVGIEIEKRLPVQGGLGAGSSNGVATMIGLERALKKRMTQTARLRVASAVGSDLPLFVIGGTVLGVGRGEEVYPVVDLAGTPVVIVARRWAYRRLGLLRIGTRSRGMGMLTSKNQPSFARLDEARAAVPTRRFLRGQN